MKTFVVFFRQEPIRNTSKHEMLSQISPAETIHDEADGVCHILPFRVCLTFTSNWREREMNLYYCYYYCYYYYYILCKLLLCQLYAPLLLCF